MKKEERHGKREERNQRFRPLPFSCRHPRLPKEGYGACRLRAATKDAGTCLLRRRSVTAGETAWILPGAGFPARVPPRRAPQFRGEAVAGATGAVRCAASDAPSHPGAPRDGEEPPGAFCPVFFEKTQSGKVPAKEVQRSRTTPASGAVCGQHRSAPGWHEDSAGYGCKQNRRGLFGYGQAPALLCGDRGTDRCAFPPAGAGERAFPSPITRTSDCRAAAKRATASSKSMRYFVAAATLFPVENHVENPVFLWETPVDPFETFRFFSMQTGFFSFLFPVENGSGKPFFGAFCFVRHPQPGGANFFGKRPEKNRKKRRGRQKAGGSCHRLCV